MENKEIKNENKKTETMSNYFGEFYIGQDLMKKLRGQQMNFIKILLGIVRIKI